MYVYKIHDILYWVVNMKLLFSILLVFLISSCKTIQNKTDEIGKREIQEVSKFLQQPESELRIVMGKPDEIVHDDKGSKFLVYTKKKYNITCERKFEIDKSKNVVGFTSKGCF